MLTVRPFLPVFPFWENFRAVVIIMMYNLESLCIVSLRTEGPVTWAFRAKLIRVGIKKVKWEKGQQPLKYAESNVNRVTTGDTQPSTSVLLHSQSLLWLAH